MYNNNNNDCWYKTADAGNNSAEIVDWWTRGVSHEGEVHPEPTFHNLTFAHTAHKH